MRQLPVDGRQAKKGLLGYRIGRPTMRVVMGGKMVDRGLERARLSTWGKDRASKDDQQTHTNKNTLKKKKKKKEKSCTEK